MWNVGDRILALWPGDRQWWYPAVVCGVDDDQLEVQFDDGDRSMVPLSDVMRPEFPEGSGVQARLGRDLRYYPALVVRQRGAALLLRFTNDAEVWTSAALVRTVRQTTRPWYDPN